MANKIIRMRTEQTTPHKSTITYTGENYNAPADNVSQYVQQNGNPIVLDTMVSPELRVLQEIRLLLLVLIVMELVVLLRRK